MPEILYGRWRLRNFALIGLAGLVLGGVAIFAQTTLLQSQTLHLRYQDVSEHDLRAHFRSLRLGEFSPHIRLDFTRLCRDLQHLSPPARIDYLGNHPASPSLIIENRSDVIQVLGVRKPGQRGDETSRDRALSLLLSECEETLAKAPAELTPSPAPAQPQAECAVASKPPSARMDGVPLVGALHLGPPRALDVADNYAYVSAFQGCVFIIDVSQPSRPSVVGVARTQPVTQVHEIPFSDCTPMANRGPGVPVTPCTQSTTRVEDAFGLDAVGDYLYLAATYAGLQILDVTDRTAPKFVSNKDIKRTRDDGDLGAWDLMVQDNLAYIAGLRIVDVSDPRSTKTVASLPVFGYGGRLNYHRGHAYLTTGNVNYDGVQIVDVQDQHNPVVVGSISTGKTPGSRTAIALSGSHAYVLGGDQLHVADITDPRAPLILGSVEIPRMGQDVYVADGFAYVTIASEYPYGPSRFAGLVVVDVRTPARPLLVRSLEFNASPRSNGKGIYVAGDLAYVLVGEELQIFDARSLKNAGP